VLLLALSVAFGLALSAAAFGSALSAAAFGSVLSAAAFGSALSAAAFGLALSAAACGSVLSAAAFGLALSAAAFGSALSAAAFGLAPSAAAFDPAFGTRLLSLLFCCQYSIFHCCCLAVEQNEHFLVEFSVEESNPLFHFEWNPYVEILVVLVNIRFWIFRGKKLGTPTLQDSTEQYHYGGISMIMYLYCSEDKDFFEQELPRIRFPHRDK